MHDLTSSAGIVAIAAGAVAILALILSGWLLMRMQRLRADQRAVLGDSEHDLVAHAADLEARFAALAAGMQAGAASLGERVTTAEARLDGTLAHRAVVRYDAYGEMSGRQSTSIALLDADRSGVVLSSIHHRDHARLYAKQVHQGRSDIELSPEENEAMRLALQGDAGAEGGA